MDKIIEHGDRTRYRIHVHTGDRIGASTKAPIRIVLVGDRGRSKEIALKNSTTHKVKFQRGQVKHHHLCCRSQHCCPYISHCKDSQNITLKMAANLTQLPTQF